jgi:hemin uptake protein HemP
MSSLKTTSLDNPARHTPAAANAPATPQKISSDRLLGECGELVILHQGRNYRLRITQNGKLILTA